MHLFFFFFFFFRVSFLSRPIGFLSLTRHSPCSLAHSYIFVYLHFSLFLGHWVGAVVYSKPCPYITIWTVPYAIAEWNAFFSFISFAVLTHSSLIFLRILLYYCCFVCTLTSAVHIAFSSTPSTQSSPLPSFRQQHSSSLPHPTFTTPQPSPNPCNGVPQRGMTACPPVTLYWPVCRAGTADSTRPSLWRYGRRRMRRCLSLSVMLPTPPSSSVGEIYLSLQGFMSLSVWFDNWCLSVYIRV